MQSRHAAPSAVARHEQKKTSPVCGTTPPLITPSVLLLREVQDPPVPVPIRDRQTGRPTADLFPSIGRSYPSENSLPMAALDLASIPSNINTYERLFVWAAQCAQSIANGETVSVTPNTSADPLAQVQVAVIADNTDRFVISAYVPMDRDALNDESAKTWMAANDISESAPHTNLLSN